MSGENNVGEVQVEWITEALVKYTCPYCRFSTEHGNEYQFCPKCGKQLIHKAMKLSVDGIPIALGGTRKSISSIQCCGSCAYWKGGKLHCKYGGGTKWDGKCREYKKYETL